MNKKHIFAIVVWALAFLLMSFPAWGLTPEDPQEATGFTEEEPDFIEEGFNQLEQMILQIREDNRELIDRNQNLREGFDLLEDLAWAQGEEINRQIEINRQRDAVFREQSQALQSTIFENRILRVSLYVGVPVALVGGGILGYFLAK
ncbi:MAG: hypothetical protein FWD13_09600 [Treponema sp.]|nr:hypothetical protein [Treponema sp.]